MLDYLYEYSFYFFIYGVIGWCVEVCFIALTERTFVNRGFLNSGICPIYGIGMVIIIPILSVFKDSIIMLFIASTVLATLLELVVGFLLEKLFKQRWWDYTGEFGNIGGYICLKFSILWGIACIIALTLVHPLCELLVSYIPYIVGIPILAVLYTGLVVDIGVTIATIINFNKKLHQIDEIAASMTAISDNIGKRLSDTTLSTMELKDKYEKMIAESQKKYKRLLRAFPTMKSIKHHNALKELRQLLSKYNRK